MASVKAIQNSHWKTTSPIPSDPVYDTHPASSRKLVVQRPGPIPNDPIYQSASERQTNSPKPRVKPEALQIARNHQGRDLAYLFNPAFQIIPIGVRPIHRESKDYGKENFKKIKEIQKSNRVKQCETSRQTPVKAVYKPDKFDHIESKVAKHIQTPSAPRPSTTDGRIQRSNSLSDLSKLKESNFQKDKHLTVDKSSSENNTDTILDKENKNPSSAVGLQAKTYERPKSHVILNRHAVKNAKIKRSPSTTALDELKKKKEKDLEEYKRGLVPKYLQKRQEEWRKTEEERVANLPDPTIPEGHSLMPEAERTKTLTLLKKSKEEMTKELQSLPFSKDTMRIKHHRDSLERRLQEIDAAIKIFSRERVFIKDE